MPDTLIPVKEYARNAATLASNNDTPLERQIFRELDTGKKKLGDGATAYNSLPYMLAGATVHHKTGITVDGSGSVVTAGVKGRVQVDFTGTLVGVTLLADAAGDVEFEIEKCTFATFPGSLASIVGTNVPELVGAQADEITLDGAWTLSITAGDVLEFSIVGTPATITQVTLILYYDEAI